MWLVGRVVSVVSRVGQGGYLEAGGETPAPPPAQLGAQGGARRVGAAVARRLRLLPAAVHPRVDALPPPTHREPQLRGGAGQRQDNELKPSTLPSKEHDSSPTRGGGSSSGGCWFDPPGRPHPNCPRRAGCLPPCVGVGMCA